MVSCLRWKTPPPTSTRCSDQSTLPNSTEQWHASGCIIPNKIPSLSDCASCPVVLKASDVVCPLPRYQEPICRSTLGDGADDGSSFMWSPGPTYQIHASPPQGQVCEPESFLNYIPSDSENPASFLESYLTPDEAALSPFSSSVNHEYNTEDSFLEDILLCQSEQMHSPHPPSAQSRINDKEAQGTYCSNCSHRCSFSSFQDTNTIINTEYIGPLKPSLTPTQLKSSPDFFCDEYTRELGLSYKGTFMNSSKQAVNDASPFQGAPRNPGSDSTAQGRTKRRVPANQVEPKCRESPSTQLESLYCAIPSLQKQETHKVSDIEGWSLSTKPSKLVIMSSATAYIRQLEKDKKLLQDENQLLRTRIKALQALVKCEDCLLMQYVMDLKINSNG